MKIFSKAGLLTFLLFFMWPAAEAQNGYNCYPSNWWVGMKNTKLQLMIHGDAIANAAHGYSISYPGVRIAKVNKVESENYIFLDLVIAPNTKPGIIKIKVNRANSTFDIPFELKARRKGNGRLFATGITSSDLIYLIMPDRFANGDPSNDAFDDLRDPVVNRGNNLLRHGGDLKGIRQHLDYLKDLGITALWLTPVMENDMPAEQEPPGPVSGYHGYWITDHYQVDKRFGTNDEYAAMVAAAHQKGMKVIQDAVYNHIGIRHWSVTDPPMKDWLNNWPSYQGTHHREEVFIDPYASDIDKKIMIDGWFVPHLADLNLRNPYVANYIIQNTIWATEEFGIDGWRVDTYKYNDENFLIRINGALAAEYPKLTSFGEVTSNTVTASAYFTKNNINAPIKHNIDGVTDFPVCYAMLAGMNEKFGWTNGVNKLYMALAQDLLYQDASHNCIFLDNHDMDRVLTVVGEDISKLKMGLNWLLTLRGIPQLYYGTEILMKNSRHPSDGEVRLDFPGGWAGDKENKFTAVGRSAKENDMFNYIRTLARFRQSSSAIKKGGTTEYIPQNGLYVYFRFDKSQTIMVAANTGEKKGELKMERFSQRTNGFAKMRNVLTGEVMPLQDMSLEPKQSNVFELLR